MVICSSKKKVFGYFLYGFLSLIFLFWSTKFNIIFKIVTLSISITYRLLSRGVHMIKKKKKKSRGVHRSVRVEFVPNPEPTHSHRVRSWTTRCRLPAISGRVGSGSVGQRLGQSKLEWVSTSRSLPNLRQESLNLRWISPNLCCIFAKSVDFSLELCDNHDIEARKTTQAQIWMRTSISSSDLRHIFIGSLPDLLIFLQIRVATTGLKQKTPLQAQIWAKTIISSPNLTKTTKSSPNLSGSR